MPTKQYSEQEIEERYQKLPEELQAAMYDFDIADQTFEIGKKHGLSTDKIGALAEDLGYVVLGFIGPREFTRELSSDLGIDMERARGLASEVNRTLFAPLREALRTHDLEITEEDIQHGGEELVRREFRTKNPATDASRHSGADLELKTATIPESKPAFPGITPIRETGNKKQDIEIKPEVPVPPAPDKTDVADIDVTGRPSWISSKPAPTPTSPPTPMRSEGKSAASSAQPKPGPKIQPTPDSTPAPSGTSLATEGRPTRSETHLEERQTELKKEPQMVPPPPRSGPRIPPIDLRNGLGQARPATTTPLPTPQRPPQPTPQPPKPTLKSYKEEDPYKEPVD